MKVAFKFVSIAVLLAILPGCAIYTGIGTEDVTHNPKYQGGYAAGDVYQLQSDGALLVSEAGTKDEAHYLMPIGTANWYTSGRHSIFSKVADVPKGATVRIDKLQIEDDLFLFEEFNLGGSIVHFHFGFFAYGDVTTPSAKWSNVKIGTCKPYYGMKVVSPPDWCKKQGSVFILGPDTDFLKPVPHS